MKKIYAIIGAGGHGRTTLEYVEKHDGEVVFCIEGLAKEGLINGTRALPLDVFLALPHEKFYAIAIGDSKTRERISLSLAYKQFNIIAQNALVSKFATIGEGCLISSYAYIGANAQIGRNFHANIYSYVEHDCVVGDFVTLAPRVSINGNVHIGAHAYIGAGAIIRNGSAQKPLMIGAGAVIGMGAVVLQDVLPFTTVVGNPARLLHSKS